MRRLALLAALTLLPGSWGSAAVPASATGLKLQLTQGGALLVGRVTVPRADSVQGVWSGTGRARLLDCTPRCRVVKVLPLDRSLLLGKDARYRIVLGGTFRVGQKVSLVLRFQHAPLMNVTATVTN